MRYRLLLCSACFCVCSCVKETAADDEFWQDGLAADIMKIEFVALYEAKNQASVRDQLRIDIDTIRLEQGVSIMTERPRGEPEQWRELDTTHFLVVKAVYNSLCELNIYDSKGDSIGRGFLSVNAALRLARPDLDYFKAYFYDTHKSILRRYQIALCKKYKISEDELDSLSYIVNQKLDSSILDLTHE